METTTETVQNITQSYSAIAKVTSSNQSTKQSLTATQHRNITNI